VAWRRQVGTAGSVAFRSNARRQSDELAGAGIPQSNLMPLYQILKRVEKRRKGGLRLDPRSVLVIKSHRSGGDRALR
jgi:hypothetical protein